LKITFQMRTSFSHTAERFGSNSKLNPWKAQSDSEVQYRDLEKMSIGNEQDLKDYKIKHRRTLLLTFSWKIVRWQVITSPPKMKSITNERVIWYSFFIYIYRGEGGELGSWGFENDVIFAHICRWIHRKLQIEIRCCRWLGTCILYGQGSLFLCGDFSHGEGKYFSTKLRIFFLKVEFFFFWENWVMSCCVLLAIGENMEDAMFY